MRLWNARGQIVSERGRPRGYDERDEQGRVNESEDVATGGEQTTQPDGIGGQWAEIRSGRGM